MKSSTLEMPRLKSASKTDGIIKNGFAKKALVILSHIAVAAVSFFSAGCTVLKYCNPFALALAASVPAKYTPAAIIGAGAGYFFAGYEIIPLRYIVALLIVIILKRLIMNGRGSENPLTTGISALIASALTGSATSLFLDEVSVTLIPYTVEAVITGASAVFLAGAFVSLKNMKSINSLKDSERATLLVSAFIMILSFSYLEIFSLKISSIAAALIVLLSAYYTLSSGAAIAGILAGVFLSIGQGDFSSFVPFCLGGLFAGLGMAYNRFLCSLALGLGFVVVLIFYPSFKPEISEFIEIGIAIGIFLIIPSKILKKFRFLNNADYSVSSAGIKEQAVSRLRFAADALSSVSDSVDKVHAKLGEYGGTKKVSVYLNTMNKTCDKCGLKYYCWEHEKRRTVDTFKKIEKMLENDVELSKENLPDDFGSVCIKAERLIKNFTVSHASYAAATLAERKSEGLREIMALQFDAMSEMLFELSEDIENREIPDSVLTDSLADLLDYYEVKYDCASVTGDKDFRLKVSLRLPYRQKASESEKFLKDLNEICSRCFASPIVYEFESSAMLEFFEKPVYEIQTGFCQLSADNNANCGDAFEIISDYFGKSAIILSDGMGKGDLASVNGTLAASILAKLLKSGFSVGAAIKTVNTALISKGNDESFATVDIVSFDLFNAKADFFKAGATSSYFLRKGKSGKVELSSMPIGILDTADFSKTSLSLGSGDIVLMLSDGATQGNSEWIGEVLEKKEYETPADLAKLVAAKASKMQYGVHEDDISVIAMFIK